MTDSLMDLVNRRLGELDLTLRAAWLRLPADEQGHRAVSYETVRRIRGVGHTNISDPTADALAVMLDVTADEIIAAAGQPPRLGRFELPSRADRLPHEQRTVVLAVIDALLHAAGHAGSAASD